uniref:Polyprotein n=1 Tax=Leptobrachium leishanense TaxID=445787 RepID=A0A8C5LYT0_9ANUR
MQQSLSTAYHPQTNGQTERTNGTLEQYLRCFTSHLQDDWADLLPIAEFAYNNQIHRSTNASPFFVNYGRHPVMFPGSPLVSDVPSLDHRMACIHNGFKQVRSALLSAQRSYKQYADRHRDPAPLYKVGDVAWLSSKHVTLNCPSRKLGPRFLGPFPVIKVVSPSAVRLCLPDDYKIHPVFHVSLLRPSEPDPFPDRTPSCPGPVVAVNDDEYEVQEILDSRFRRRRLEYLVHWTGYGPEEDSWVSAADVHAPALVRDFHMANPKRPRSGRLVGGLCQGSLPLTLGCAPVPGNSGHADAISIHPPPSCPNYRMNRACARFPGLSENAVRKDAQDGRRRFRTSSENARGFAIKKTVEG